MKLKIKVLNVVKDSEFIVPTVISKGDWVDLRAAEDVKLIAPQASTLKYRTTNGVKESYRNVTFDSTNINLGIAMQLPKGFEAIVLPRSSTYKNTGTILANSMGVIDNTYCGNEDEWKYPVIALREVEILKGDRICQFRIQLSQKATMWQKLKWFLSSGIEFIEVESLNNESRGGIGSTGVK